MEPDQAGRADADLDRADTEQAGDGLGDGVGRLEPVRTGVALAPPEFRTTARTDAVLDDRLTPEHRLRLAPGLAVKTLAASKVGPSLTTSATSLAPVDFRPATTPAARKPAGVVMLMARFLPW